MYMYRTVQRKHTLLLHLTPLLPYRTPYVRLNYVQSYVYAMPDACDENYKFTQSIMEKFSRTHTAAMAKS